jgi:hypothetical protein
LIPEASIVARTHDAASRLIKKFSLNIGSELLNNGKRTAFIINDLSGPITRSPNQQAVSRGADSADPM